MKDFFQINKIPLLLVLTATAFYIAFAYDLERSEFIKLFTLYSGLFFLSWKIIQLKKYDFWFLAGIAILFRIVFLEALPNLSQDFYRFIWDGRLLAAGFNPYLYLPEEIIAVGNLPVSQARELFSGMGELSASHYTNYPPLNQAIFAVAAFLAGKSIWGSVLILRLFIIAADVGILFFGKKLLENLNLPVHRIFWYFLNPFIIIELTGNLHFEGVMLFFLLISLYFLKQEKWLTSAVFFAFSVLLKLLPLLFLPLLFQYFRSNKRSLGIRKLILYYLLVGLVTIAGFLPFLSSGLILNMSNSIGLWFQKFEFNASIYYLVRWVGFQVKGYNIIATAGKILPLITVLVLLLLSFIRRNNSLERLATAMLLGVSVYLFFSTTVHPWYIATPLLLSVFTKYKFPLAWSFLVILSYFAYSQEAFEENLWLIAAEYLIVIGAFIFEISRNERLENYSSTGSFSSKRLRT